MVPGTVDSVAGPVPGVDPETTEVLASVDSNGTELTVTEVATELVGVLPGA